MGATTNIPADTVNRDLCQITIQFVALAAHRSMELGRNWLSLWEPTPLTTKFPFRDRVRRLE